MKCHAEARLCLAPEATVRRWRYLANLAFCLLQLDDGCDLELEVDLLFAQAVPLKQLGAAGVGADAAVAVVDDHRGLSLLGQLVVVGGAGQLLGGVVGAGEGEAGIS